jgi:hypothetical protein
MFVTLLQWRVRETCAEPREIGIFIIARGPTYRLVKDENKNAGKNSSHRLLLKAA